MSDLRERQVGAVAERWADAYAARWEAMHGGEPVDPRDEADATLALWRAVRGE